MSYDYIIAGGGCAGLSLAVRLATSGLLENRTLLIIEKNPAKGNDRTWCFWETQPDIFEPVVHHRWQHIYFYSSSFSKLLDIAPFQYKLIRGEDFYRHCHSTLQKYPQVQLITDQVQAMGSDQHTAWVKTDRQSYTSGYVFSSIMPAEINGGRYHQLLQHFKGWFIKTPVAAFNPNEATLMDFRLLQRGGTTFIYVLPFSAHEALVEYTLFSPALLPDADYDAALKEYISQFLKIDRFEVGQVEFGVIPMTNYRFPLANQRVIYMGTAGGQTKASSGYTFKFIQKRTQAIAEALQRGLHPAKAQASVGRFAFYDSVLLNVLANGRLEGRDVFARLFEKCSPQQVLRFLDNDSRLLDDLRLMNVLPKIPFAKAAWQEFVNR